VVYVYSVPAAVGQWVWLELDHVTVSKCMLPAQSARVSTEIHVAVFGCIAFALPCLSEHVHVHDEKALEYLLEN